MHISEVDWKSATGPIRRGMAATQRRETIAARRRNEGCECHGVDLVLCPEYRPKVWEGIRVSTPKWGAPTMVTR